MNENLLTVKTAITPFITAMGTFLENAVKMGVNIPAWLVKQLKASANLVEAAGDQSTGTDNVK